MKRANIKTSVGGGDEGKNKTLEFSENSEEKPGPSARAAGDHQEGAQKRTVGD